MRAIAFAVNVAHSKHLAAAFNAAGIRAAHLDADTSKEERAENVARMVRGEVLVITNCQLATEGGTCAPSLNVTSPSTPSSWSGPRSP